MALVSTNIAKDTTLQEIIHAEDDAHVSGDKGVLMLCLRSDNDIATANDGDYTTPKMDERGRLKVASMPASYTPTTGNIAANGQTVPINCERFSNLMIHCTGTFSTVNCTFEGSLNSTNGTDGNWFGVQAVRSNANTIETTTGNLSAAPVYAWELSVNGLKYFRVRATAWTSGTQVWTFIAGTYATEPIPAAQTTATQAVSGTVTANTVLGSPTNASIVNSANSTNGTVVKASAGNIHSITASNNGILPAYLKFHNSASVTAGTTAVAMWFIIPASSNIHIPFGALGARFSAGICLSITSGLPDNDTSAVSAGQVKVITSFI